MEMFFSMAFRQVETHSVASREGRGNRKGVIFRLMSARGRSGLPKMGTATLNHKTAGVWQQRDTLPSGSWGLTRIRMEHKENERSRQ
jgi:hypothetical protein